MVKQNKTTIGISLIFLEVSLLLVLFTLIPNNVIAGIGSPNATVTTYLDIGNVWPEILNVSINDDAASFALTPNDTTTLTCISIIRDYNGDSDIASVNVTFYDSVASNSTGSDDNNDHYTNASCEIVADAGVYNTYDTSDPYYSLANCTLEIEYYANPQDWVCNVTVADNVSWIAKNSDDITISQLLALGVPDTINYGTVNATYVSEENITNITNYGNIQINLSLEGYGTTEGDDLAMNCSLGNIGVIDASYQRYNLTASNPGQLSLSEFEGNYTNLTSSVMIKQFELDYRANDTANEAIKESYWRIYVPVGVAGTCNGTIIFGATSAEAS